MAIIHLALIIGTSINNLARIKNALSMSRLVLPFTVRVVLPSTVIK